MKDKYLWFTDTHLDKVMPWTLTRFLAHLRHEKPKGIFLTGDISNGALTPLHLRALATSVTCPIYFILGNHDYHFTSIEKQHDTIRKLCQDHPNLVWVTDNGVIHLSEEVALIGTEGWYDAEEGKPEYLKLTFDWFLTKDFRELPDMKSRIKFWRKLADESANDIADKLEKAIEQDYKTIYLMTHFPPWKEATRDIGTFMEKFWLPYNTNLRLGRVIEKIMEDHKKRYVTVLAGHTHNDCWIHVARNVDCKVSKAKYYGETRNEEHIFI
jgi:predicted phosphohydrolase